MLIDFGKEIKKLTDLRISYQVNAKGQLLKGIKIITIFDKEMIEFISSYLRGEKIMNWLNNLCHVSFEQNGTNRQLILFDSKYKRLDINLSTFPTHEDLNRPWRSIVSSKRVC